MYGDILALINMSHRCGRIAKLLYIQSLILFEEESGHALGSKTILTFVVVALSLKQAYDACNKFCFQLLFLALPL